jgi:hypothetical protein
MRQSLLHFLQALQPLTERLNKEKLAKQAYSAPKGQITLHQNLLNTKEAIITTRKNTKITIEWEK